ncbi:hypothetical protein CPter91_2682 [Collimonas pratensis]|uniref:Uncharacterized protein n=1 Tax=Collimonas pratensis TaxID=279113 RepID=A0A127Q4M0_9BURK|nr:hypothetical protein CPter91_2682 [Collimonas pratensis]
MILKKPLPTILVIAAPLLWMRPGMPGICTIGSEIATNSQVKYLK